MTDGISINAKKFINYRTIENNLQSEDSEDKKLEQSCDDFEAVLLGYMLKTMRQTVPEDSLLGSTNQQEIFQSMFDQEMSTHISRSEKSLGIGDALYNELKDGKNPKQDLFDLAKQSFQRKKHE